MVKIESLGIDHERKDEIEARILGLKDSQTKFIDIIKKVKEEFSLTLKQAIDFVRLYFPR